METIRYHANSPTDDWHHAELAGLIWIDVLDGMEKEELSPHDSPGILAEYEDVDEPINEIEDEG